MIGKKDPCQGINIYLHPASHSLMFKSHKARVVIPQLWLESLILNVNGSALFSARKERDLSR